MFEWEIGNTQPLPSKIKRNVTSLLPGSEVNNKYEWTPECEKLFQDLKQHHMTLPPLTKPSKGDTVFLYLTTNPVVVSSLLVKVLSKGQVPIYYVCKVLTKAEINYLKVLKYLYALVISARKLGPSFHEYEITVLRNQPLKQFLEKHMHQEG